MVFTQLLKYWFTVQAKLINLMKVPLSFMLYQDDLRISMFNEFLIH